MSNFTLEQVHELLGQYTDEVGQAFAPEVIESLHKQTGGQPFLVNRFAQILTTELEIPKTGRMDLLILHNTRKYVVETKIWEGDLLYEAGKKQLAKYLRIENVNESYYVVFDHRKNPQLQVETQTLQDLTIRSYVIPVVQERPSKTD